jgi:hypothetical protein
MWQSDGIIFKNETARMVKKIVVETSVTDGFVLVTA